MALSIKDDEADRLARELAKRTGESLTEAVTQALKERLQRLQLQKHRSLADELDDIALRCARLPRQDGRSADDIIGYDEYGLPR
ncbi:type II toxin-antitoxin system VapB family antitoxin [Oceanibaculum pacificum]|uniref:Antitoxin n=1 Tax=Oceanibaculum pacificum TaxID=580166 RepID=A0A154W963_9PROT|nr:type II toxin-antitoxin system VapB family antitoxin [Oceanibaculum pacificum]KZD10003.1 antitoxin [Oceanibaculum pacificum]